MRGFLGRAGALLGRALVSFGLGSQGSGEAPVVDRSRGCLTVGGRPASTLRLVAGPETSLELDAGAEASIAVRGRPATYMVIEYEVC